MMLRTETGDIRFIWKLVIALILNLLLIVVSRFSLIFVVQQVFVLQGTDPTLAFEDAQLFISESAEGQAMAGTLDLLLIFLLVFLFVTRIEKKDFHFTDLGMKLQRNTIPLTLFGILIGGVLFLGSILIGIGVGSLGLPVIPHLEQWSSSLSIFAAMLFFTVNSFWQELLFRGYLQTRAVDEHGRIIGITVVAVIFVVFHGLVQSLTLVNTLTGIMLFLFIGLVYDKTKSLYLVGAIHAILNFLPVLFDIVWQGLEAATIYGIALLLVVLMLYVSNRKQ